MDQNIQQELDYLIKIGGQLDAYVYGDEIPHIQEPQFMNLENELPLAYTKTQFFGCLFNLIIQTAHNQKRMEKLKKKCKNLGFRFKVYFEKYTIIMNFNNQGQEQIIQKAKCAISIFESMFLKIFQTTRQEDYFNFLMSNFIDYLQPGKIIQECDFNLIKRIVYSNKVKPLIRQLNKIKFQNQSEDDLNKEINELLQELPKNTFTSLSQAGQVDIYGLTCLDGQIIYDEMIFNYQNQKEKEKAIIYRAVLIITYIHEVFFHLKRIRYCHMDNVLKSTPPEYSCGENTSEDSPRIAGEAGEYFEYKIFKDQILKETCSEDLALAILTPEKWEDDNFQFWTLVNTQGSPKKQYQQGSPLMKKGSQIMSPPSKNNKFLKCLSSLGARKRQVARTTQ